MITFSVCLNMEENGTTFESVHSKTWKKFPFTLVNVDEITEKRILKHIKGPFDGLLQIGAENWKMPKHYIEHAEELYNFEARFNDIYTSSYPRSGTTWTQEMIWLLCNDLNFEAAKATNLDWRFLFLEYTSLHPKQLNDPILKSIKEQYPEVETLANTTHQRFIKTHLPIKLLPYSALEKGCKIVYIARNPKDVIVSYYHFAQQNQGFMWYNGTFTEFVDFVMDDLILWSPYFEHIKDGWSRRNDKNIFFLFFEDLIMDLQGSLKKLATFLERPLNDADLPELLHHLKFENFKQNSAVNKEHRNKIDSTVKYDFIRRGKIGGNPEMTPEIDQKINEWTEKQLVGCDLKFPHQSRHQM